MKCLTYLGDGCVICYYYVFWMDWSLCHFIISLFCPLLQFLAYFVRCKYSYSHFFPIIWNIIFHPFTLTVYLSLNLKWISLTVWCHFKNSFSHSVPFNGEINPLKFRVIIDMWGFTDANLFSCFVFPLFLFLSFSA